MDCKDRESQQCLIAFAEKLQNFMSGNCMIPIQLPKESIYTIIDQAKKMFVKSYEDFVETQYLAISKNEIVKRSFQKGIGNELNDGRGTLLLPDEVVSVIGVYSMDLLTGESGWNNQYNIKTGDFAIQRQIYSQTLSRNLSKAADNTTFYIVNMSFLDLTRQLFQSLIAFKYNRLTKKLRILSDLPKDTVVLKVLTEIPDCAKYEDDLFFRYCVAECKVQLSRILSTFSYSLPGGVSINVEAIQGDGQQEKAEILQELKDMSPNAEWIVF